MKLFLALIFALIYSANLLAQDSTKTTSVAADSNSTEIEIVQSDKLKFGEINQKKINLLQGNVILKQGDMLLHCDSAYFYTQENRFDAFGKVHMNQNDETHLYGDSLFYLGETFIGTLYGKEVKLEDPQITLTTNRLDFDRKKNIAYYQNFATIINKQDATKISSQQGIYYNQTENILFKKNVNMNNLDFSLRSDSLIMNSKEKILTFVAPTFIHTNDSTEIYTENGWYDTGKNKAKIYKNAKIVNKSTEITADTIFYDKILGEALGINNVFILDTANQIAIGGDFIFSSQKKDSTVITQKALMQRFFSTDTLFFHADTFRITKQIVMDSNQNVNKYNLIKCFPHAKFFKPDMQGAADSMVYRSYDSLLIMYKKPVIWSQKNQITGDTIFLHIANKQMDKMHIPVNPFVLGYVDSLEKFNQIVGKELTGFFEDGRINYLFFEKNSQAIYYLLDENEQFIGVNRSESENMKIAFNDGKMEKIILLSKPTSTIFPIDELPDKEFRLKGFHLVTKNHALKVSDIFNWEEQITEKNHDQLKKKK